MVPSSRFGRRWPTAALALLLPTLAACGEAQQLGDPDGSMSPGDCSPVCQSKATSCGEPSAAAATSCAQFCGQSPSSTALSCIQSTSCGALANAFAQTHVVCGVLLLEEAATVEMLDCSGVCMSKALTCGALEDGNAGAPDSGAAHDCAVICAKMPTQTQIACIESTSCPTLSAAFAAHGTVCGIGTDGG